MEPKFSPPFLGFTRTAEIWNSRACMIGLVGVFIIELVSFLSFLFFSIMSLLCKLFELLARITHCGIMIFQILNKGILQVIGVDVGKGLDLPL